MTARDAASQHSLLISPWMPCGLGIPAPLDIMRRRGNGVEDAAKSIRHSKKVLWHVALKYPIIGEELIGHLGDSEKRYSDRLCKKGMQFQNSKLSTVE